MGANPEIKLEDLSKEASQALVANMASITEAFPTVADAVKEIQTQLEPLKRFDAKKIEDDVDKMKAKLDDYRTEMRMGKRHGQNHPFAIPGVETEVHKFSLLRCISGIIQGGQKRHFEEVGAGFEHEVMLEHQKRMEKATQRTDNDELGGNFLPDQVLSDVIPAIYARSKFVDIFGDGDTKVRILDGLVGSPVKIPKFKDGMVAGWVGETDAFPESNSETAMVTLRRKKLGLLAMVTDEMQKWAQFGFESMFREDMIRAAAFEVDRVIPYGKGTDNEPRGWVNTQGTNFIHADTLVIHSGENALDAARIATWDGGEMDFDGLLEMMGALEDLDIEIGPDFWYMWAPIFSRRLKKLKVSNFSGQTAEKPYLLGQPFFTDSQLSTLIGNHDKSTKIKSRQKPGQSIGGVEGNSNEIHGDIFAGNMQQIIFARWAGVEIVTDGGVGNGFARDITRIKLRMHADVGVRQESELIMCPDAIQR